MIKQNCFVVFESFQHHTGASTLTSFETPWNLHHRVEKFKESVCWQRCGCLFIYFLLFRLVSRAFIRSLHGWADFCVCFPSARRF